MGGICGRPSAIENSNDSPKERLRLSRPSKKGPLDGWSKQNSSRREEGVWVQEKVETAAAAANGHGGDANASLIDKKYNGSLRRSCNDNTRIEKVEAVGHPSDGVVPHAIDQELVAAGWPVWLIEASPAAVTGWVPRRADTFEKLDKIGQGTYSNVYKARDTIDGQFVALKRVRFDNLDYESVEFMAREIVILRRLDHPNIIKLKGLITSRKSCNLYLVFEYMEHDLTGLSSLPGFKFTESQIKCYMHQLLSGLEFCHNHDILHRDIKGSNLLIDNNGVLKIADFGLANFFDPHHNYPMTSRVVTLWYRPLELLLGTRKYGTGVDLWSAGCILGELYAGRPIMPGRTEVEQVHKIYKLCGSPSKELWRKLKLPSATTLKPREPYKRCIAETFNDFPDVALRLMEILLSLDPIQRGTAGHALKSEYFTTEPLPCNPSSLPTYPPSKEMDAKLREEDARRLKCGKMPDLGRSRQKDSQAVAAPNANAGSAIAMQKRRDSLNSKSRSETYNPWKDEAVSGFAIGQHRQPQPVNTINKNASDHQRYSYSGPLVASVGQLKAGKKVDDTSMSATRTDLSNLSGVVASRTTSTVPSSDDQRDKSISSQPKVGRFPTPFIDWELTAKQDHNRHSQRISGAYQDEGITQNKDSTESKIAFSGPLVSSHKVDQMLKDHDRQVQDYARRTRQDRMRQMRINILGK